MKNVLTFLLIGCTLFKALNSHAEAIAPPQQLSAVVVIAPGTGTRTVPSHAEATKIIQRTPGGVAVVASETFEHRYSLNFEDTLKLTPGVYAQKRFGEEVRLSMRGSGLSRGFHLRGLTLLQDGIPFNLADGSGDFQESDSLAVQRLEVYKGANALQYGSATLGGAIHAISKTGKSHSGNRLRLEAGSFDTYRAHLESGYVGNQSDTFLSLTETRSHGFREHEEQHNSKFNANAATALSDTAETRFYVSANTIEQQLPGSVSLATALQDPATSPATAVSQQWARDMDSVRLANKTTIELGDDDQLDVGGFVNRKSLYHPITALVGVIDQESMDYGLFAQGSGGYSLADYRHRYRLGVTSQVGTVDAKVFENLSGSRGNRTAHAKQDAQHVALYGENHIYIHPQWALITGAQLSWSSREVNDRFAPAESDRAIYRAFNPKLGVLYEPQPGIQFFANASRSHEVPTFSELTQSGTAGFTPVDAQRAWTAELGTRGESARIAWELSLFRAWLVGEMLQFTTGPSIPAATFNAENTIHQGVESGLAIRLADSVFSAGDAIVWRQAYTYSDYYFVDDPQYSNNHIPGQPRHFYQTEWRYDHPQDWFVAIDWEVVSTADVDFANTLQTPGYGLLGLNAGYAINQQLTVFLDGRNLLNKRYISTFSTLVNTAGNTAVFYPGEGRGLFAGIEMRF